LLNQLSLCGHGYATKATAADRGRWLCLVIETTRPHTDIPEGLDQLRDLTITASGIISAAPLARLADLRTLWLRWQGAAGHWRTPSVSAT
jgi:hypothetical protein